MLGGVVRVARSCECRWALQDRACTELCFPAFAGCPKREESAEAGTMLKLDSQAVSDQTSALARMGIKRSVEELSRPDWCQLGNCILCFESSSGLEMESPQQGGGSACI